MLERCLQLLRATKFPGAVIGRSRACCNTALIACNQRTCVSQIRVEFLKAKNS